MKPRPAPPPSTAEVSPSRTPSSASDTARTAWSMRSCQDRTAESSAPSADTPRSETRSPAASASRRTAPNRPRNSVNCACASRSREAIAAASAPSRSSRFRICPPQAVCALRRAAEVSQPSPSRAPNAFTAAEVSSPAYAPAARVSGSRASCNARATERC
ncbi:hypothetical protein [Streptomyces sp. LaPpAH-108]|uniref:hypothetical protein n=1 Tax=Streptomyces sp. LaPpAH-108 TaxID=1155714 RepID=UPI00131A2A45|nr:hypothetical protein [Streptomyces sp. LaPpAH-108]